MPFCPTCSAEYREGFNRCSDCKEALVASLPESMRGAPPSLTCAYATTIAVEAEFLCVVLRDHGIEATLDNEGGAMYAIGLPTTAAPLRIMVADRDAEEALKIIQEHFGERAKKDKEARPPATAEEIVFHERLEER